MQGWALCQVITVSGAAGLLQDVFSIFIILHICSFWDAFAFFKTEKQHRKPVLLFSCTSASSGASGTITAALLECRTALASFSGFLLRIQQFHTKHHYSHNHNRQYYRIHSHTTFLLHLFMSTATAMSTAGTAVGTSNTFGPLLLFFVNIAGCAANNEAHHQQHN